MTNRPATFDAQAATVDRRAGLSEPHCQRKLGETPEVVKQLTQYQDDVSKIPHMHLTILPLTLDIVQASVEVRKREGLLTNDSFVMAFMREQGLTQLATANGDFDRLVGMTIYKPTDLEGQDTPENRIV